MCPPASLNKYPGMGWMCSRLILSTEKLKRGLSDDQDKIIEDLNEADRFFTDVLSAEPTDFKKELTALVMHRLGQSQSQRTILDNHQKLTRYVIECASKKNRQNVTILEELQEFFMTMLEICNKQIVPPQTPRPTYLQNRLAANLAASQIVA